MRRIEEKTENWKKQEDDLSRKRENREEDLAVIKEESKRKRKLEDEKKNEEKLLRKSVQKKKGEKWEMIRWLNKFIEENKDNWKREKQKRDEEKEMTVYKWEKRRRFEKIEEIKKRRENAKKIPHLDYKELWSWRENQNQGEIMTPHTTPRPD